MNTPAEALAIALHDERQTRKPNAVCIWRHIGRDPQPSSCWYWEQTLAEAQRILDLIDTHVLIPNIASHDPDER